MSAREVLGAVRSLAMRAPRIRIEIALLVGVVILGA
jgi:hypothetical protein